MVSQKSIAWFHFSSYAVYDILSISIIKYFRKEFLRESGWLTSLRDPNVTRIIGVCSQDEPLCILQEHCEFGDLPTFLQLQAGAPQDDNPALR